MKRILPFLTLTILVLIGCQDPLKKDTIPADQGFSTFEKRFLDQYWKQYPSSAIFIGYGKYYENLVIPDSAAYAAHVQFSGQWIDSINKLDFKELNDNNKISYNIIKNQLESDIWYQSIFKLQQWDAATYNLSGESFYLIHQPYAPLDDRLRTLSKHLEKAGQYYQAALNVLNRPTRESVGLSLMQNLGGLSIFGKDLIDSIRSSHLTAVEIDTLNQRVAGTVQAIQAFTDSLKAILANKNYTFRDFPIGKEFFREKFKYDLATDFTPEEIYEKAMNEKKSVYASMYQISASLWTKYYQHKSRPADSADLIQKIIDAVSLQHAKPSDFFDSLRNQVYELKRFIIRKDLFDFDTSYPIIVRIMPEYARGFSIASADFTPPYQKKGDTYFNIDDLTKFPKEKAESTLRELNNFASQLLSIHEAIPGHCLQGIYNNLKSPDVLRSVFQNGAMIEGWAVYTETMMLENGWADNSLEIQLMHGKLKLRELGNVIVDYDMQCLSKPKDYIMDFLIRGCFQTTAQANEKYHRATLSQVQLCSYYAGATAILELRKEYKTKMGTLYSLKDFHEKFLSFGSSPVKYIRERMIQQ
jgi:uncharacterized protein (DUF885 family)